MKQQFLDLKGLTELVVYLKDSIANKKVILPYASNKLFPSVGDINTIYIDTATNTIYRWDSSSKTYITLAKAVKSVVISEATENGKITLTVDGNKTTVPIHGLGSAAYTNSSAYSPAGHTHTKAQVGLGNVDNTADANKSVKHATTADSATTAGTATNVSATQGTDDAARHVWFSDSATETKRAYSDKFKYNPVTNNLTVNVTGNAATASSVAWGNVSGRPSSMPASDVYAWAKASSKPSYSWGEITGKPSTFTPASHSHNYAGSSSAGGNANAAVKLATARKIGNASFDGTTDVTLAEIGAIEIIPIATTTLGGIKPDGKTTFVDETGILRAKGGGTTVTPKPVNNLTIENANASVTIKWQDPENTVISGSTFSTWAGTKLVMKETGYPANPNDETLVTDNMVRDKYKTTGYTVTGLTNGKKYYFALFPYSTDGVYNYDAGNRLLGEPESLKIVTFADGTDAEIEKMIEAHYAGKINIKDYWAVGDKRTIHHNAMSTTGVSESHKANDYTYVIIGIEHDDLVTAINGKTKAAITIQTERILYLDTTTEYNNSYDTSHECGYMNSSDTNGSGWESCARRIWCNNVYKKCLPTYIQNMMKQVKKLTSAGGRSSIIKTSNDYAFLPSEIEIFGSTSYSFAGEGKQYQYFKNATANRYKKPRYNSSYISGWWWERSPSSSSSSHFCTVTLVNNPG